MARYLFTAWSFPGHLNPNITVAQALRDRDHEVAFYTGPRASAVLSELGINVFTMRHVDEDVLYQRLFSGSPSNLASSVAELLRARAMLKIWLVDTVMGQLADLEPVLDDWQPDILVCDPAMLAPFLVLREARHLPVAILSYTTGCMLSGPDAPLWGRGLAPPTTVMRRLRGDIERMVAHHVNRGFRTAASAIRARYGLAPLITSITDFGGTVPLYLVTSVPELDYNRRDLPPNVQYVGPCTWDRPSDRPPPPWMSALSQDRPIVYVTEGTVQGSQPLLLQAAARGLGGLPLQVILSLNAGRDPSAAGLASLAPNVRVESYVPGQGWQSDILTRASLMITNGGAGSVLAALSAGVPLIVAPTAWDKPENAQRVAEAGAGVRLPANRCTPEHLCAAVQHVLGEPSFRANASRVAEALHRCRGPARAAELLDSLAPFP